MANTILMLFVIIFLKLNLLFAESGVCTVIISGSLTKQCCADYEEKNSKCEPCPNGSISEAGHMCRPCPSNSFGNLCLKECDCEEFQRCDNQIGCVDKGTTESSYDIEQTVTSTGNDFTTFSWLFTKSSKMITLDNASAFSAREIIVYYTLSLVVLILMIGLCFVIIKHQRGKRKRHTVHINRPEQESVNQIFENSEHSQILEINEYEEINDAEMINIDLQPNIIHHDYLEVVAESESSQSSKSGDRQEQIGYLNPYQPCVQTDDTKHSYERLQSQKIGTSGYSDENNMVLQDKDSYKILNQSESTVKSRQCCVNEINKNNENSGYTTGKSFAIPQALKLENMIRSISCFDLRENMLSHSVLSDKFKTL